MNVLYIIGNGFDIAQGLKTSYKDFEKWYKKLETEDSILKRFRNEINPDSALWSDLELALGKYVANLQSVEEFDTIYYDLVDRIEEYMKIQNAQFKINSSSIHDYRKHAAFPDDFLEVADAEPIIGYFKSCLLPNDSVTIDAINFNYTDTFDRVMGFNSNDTDIYPSRRVYTGQICHVHGSLAQLPLILGVDTIDQINNPAFQFTKEVSNILIKPKNNKAIRQNRAVHAQQLIDNADMFVIYGSSLGATDQTWWNAIYQKMLSDLDIPLVICRYTGQKRDVRKIARWLPEEIENTKNIFYNAVDNGKNVDEIRNNIEGRIMVALDKTMFQNPIKNSIQEE